MVEPYMRCLDLQQHLEWHDIQSLQINVHGPVYLDFNPGFIITYPSLTIAGNVIVKFRLFQGLNQSERYDESGQSGRVGKRSSTNLELQAVQASPSK
jgi:hypothetical protein